MEEQKIESKEVKMKPVVGKEQAEQGNSLIEELQKWDKDKLIQQVIQMNQQLYNQDNYLKKLKAQITEVNQFLSNKRMEYLFKVVEFSKTESYYKFSSDFVSDCISEIQESLTIPKEQDNKADKEG